LSLLGNIAAWQRRGQKILLIKFLKSFVLKAQPFSNSGCRLSAYAQGEMAGMLMAGEPKLSYATNPTPHHPRTL